MESARKSLSEARRELAESRRDAKVWAWVGVGAAAGLAFFGGVDDDALVRLFAECRAACCMLYPGDDAISRG